MSGCRVARSVRCIGLALALASAMPVVAAAQPALTAVGTEFVLTMAAGRILRSTDLVGATFSIVASGTTAEVTIASVEEDSHAVGGRVFLHHLVVADTAGRRTDLCSPDAEGRSLGFPVPDGRGGFDLTCTSGAIGKCIRWGYRPWEERQGGPPLAALHAACVHMARADYGGAGHATTRAGTLIYWCDRFGVQPCGEEPPVSFEAAWGRDGATCVARPRIPENVSLEELAQSYPRLRSHLGSACTEEGAMRDPAALLFNHS